MKKENENLEQVLARFVEDNTRDSTLQPNKTFAQIRPSSIDEKARTIQFVASTEAEDRYGDVIRVAGWKLDAYKRNPVVLWAHRSGDPPIGKTVSLSVEQNPPALVQTVQFATKEEYPFADTIFNLYKGGYLRAVSVGFLPLENPKPIEKDGNFSGYEFTSQELLELSAVPVPANSEALARAVHKGLLTEELAKQFAKQADEEEPSEEPEEPGETPLEELAEQVSESLDEIQAALTEAVGNLAVLTAALTGQKSVRRPAKTKSETDPVNELLSSIVVADE